MRLKARVMERGTPIANEQGHKTGGLFHSNQVAAFDYSERQAAFAARIMNCVSRAFYAIGASPQTQEIVFGRMYTTQNVGRDEIVNKPREFIEGLKTIYGEAGAVVFEYMLTREIMREFVPTARPNEEISKGRNLPDLLQMVATGS